MSGHAPHTREEFVERIIEAKEEKRQVEESLMAAKEILEDTEARRAAHKKGAPITADWKAQQQTVHTLAVELAKKEGLVALRQRELELFLEYRCQESQPSTVTTVFATSSPSSEPLGADTIAHADDSSEEYRGQESQPSAATTVVASSSSSSELSDAAITVPAAKDSSREYQGREAQPSAVATMVADSSPSSEPSGADTILPANASSEDGTALNLVDYGYETRNPMGRSSEKVSITGAVMINTSEAGSAPKTTDVPPFGPGHLIKEPFSSYFGGQILMPTDPARKKVLQNTSDPTRITHQHVPQLGSENTLTRNPEHPAPQGPLRSSVQVQMNGGGPSIPNVRSSAAPAFCAPLGSVTGRQGLTLTNGQSIDALHLFGARMKGIFGGGYQLPENNGRPANLYTDASVVANVSDVDYARAYTPMSPGYDLNLPQNIFKADFFDESRGLPQQPSFPVTTNRPVPDFTPLKVDTLQAGTNQPQTFDTTNYNFPVDVTRVSGPVDLAPNQHQKALFPPITNTIPPFSSYSSYNQNGIVRRPTLMGSGQLAPLPLFPQTISDPPSNNSHSVVNPVHGVNATTGPDPHSAKAVKPGNKNLMGAESGAGVGIKTEDGIALKPRNKRGRTKGQNGEGATRGAKRAKADKGSVLRSENADSSNQAANGNDDDGQGSKKKAGASGVKTKIDQQEADEIEKAVFRHMETRDEIPECYRKILREHDDLHPWVAYTDRETLLHILTSARGNVQCIPHWRLGDTPYCDEDLRQAKLKADAEKAKGDTKEAGDGGVAEDSEGSATMEVEGGVLGASATNGSAVDSGITKANAGDGAQVVVNEGEKSGVDVDDSVETGADDSDPKKKKKRVVDGERVGRLVEGVRGQRAMIGKDGEPVELKEGCINCGCDEEESLLHYQFQKTWTVEAEDPTTGAMVLEGMDSCLWKTRMRCFMVAEWKRLTGLKVDDCFIGRERFVRGWKEGRTINDMIMELKGEMTMKTVLYLVKKLIVHPSRNTVQDANRVIAEFFGDIAAQEMVSAHISNQAMPAQPWNGVFIPQPGNAFGDCRQSFFNPNLEAVQ